MDTLFGLLIVAVWLLIFRRVFVADEMDSILEKKHGKMWKNNKSLTVKLFYSGYYKDTPAFLFCQNILLFLSAGWCILVAAISIGHETSKVVTITVIYAFFLSIYTYVFKTVLSLILDSNRYRGLSKFLFIICAVAFILLLLYGAAVVIWEYL